MVRLWAYRISPVTRIGESFMPRRLKRMLARRSAPQQIDLFAGVPETMAGGIPAWSGLPRETQEALTDLMTRLLLEHADKTEGGHDH
jgi:hypothetical protein